MFAKHHAVALGILSLSFASAPLRAADDLRYTVVPRDTLIGIGERLLAQPGDWRRVQAINRVDDPYRLQPGRVLRIPAGLLKPDPLDALVESVTGEVLINGQPARAGMRLALTQPLRTGADGYAVLVLPDESRLVVKPDSSLRLETLQRDRVQGRQASRIELQSGRVDNRVQPQRGPAARYEIRTPTAIIGVRGTEFRATVGADGKAARIEVTEGSVLAGQVRRGPLQRGLAVPAGHGAVLGEGATQRSLPLLPRPELSGIPLLFERPLMRVPLPSSAAAQAHRVLVLPAGEGNWGRILHEQTVSGREARIPGLPDGDYRLVLRAIDARGLEGMDAGLDVRLKARPEPPFATQPRAGGKQRGEAVQLAWTGQAGIARYRIEIAGAGGFANPVYRHEAVDDTQLSVPLPPGDYQWRLGSIRPDGDRGPWGDAQSFTLGAPQAAPDAPSLDDAGLNFAWPGEPGQRFAFELAEDAGFTRVLERREVAEPKLNLPSPGGGTYYVRVRATDADGFVGEWSSTQQFDVPYNWKWLLLLTPLLLL